MRGEKETARFRESMLEKLAENGHKGSWSEVQPSRLMLDLRNEVWELQMELSMKALDPQKIRRECADIGNLAMFIADVTGGLDEH